MDHERTRQTSTLLRARVGWRLKGNFLRPLGPMGVAFVSRRPLVFACGSAQLAFSPRSTDYAQAIIGKHRSDHIQRLVLLEAGQPLL